MNEWNDWGLKSGLYNYKPVRSKNRKKELARLNESLSETAAKFIEIIGEETKSIFGYLVSEPSADHERYWGNDFINVTVFREENEYFVTVVDCCPDGSTPTGFTLSFAKPLNWKAPVIMTPYCATGNADAIIALAGLFLLEWQKCHKLRFSQAKDCWV